MIDLNDELLIKLKEHDQLTYEHSIRVATLMFRFGKYLNYKQRVLVEMFLLGLYHDIGKIHVEKSILQKKDKLNDSEYNSILNHTIYGECILKKKGFNNNFIQSVRSHHENFDGSGYPDKLYEKQIPGYAAVLRIVDSYDAMTSARSYKQVFSSNYALSQINKLSGSWYHSELAKLFRMMMDKNIGDPGRVQFNVSR